MLPLAIFLGIWIILVFLNGILTLVTLGQYFKYATPGILGYGYALIFIGVILTVILACGSYFYTVDWEQDIDVIPSSIQSMIPGPHVEDTLLEP